VVGMPIWLKRAPASILIFFRLVPEVIGTVSDWERIAVPQPSPEIGQ
jgi:hypothetical protein